eukprot:8974243-Pyramimonas_sp.AAC.1
MWLRKGHRRHRHYSAPVDSLRRTRPSHVRRAWLQITLLEWEYKARERPQLYAQTLAKRLHYHPDTAVLLSEPVLLMGYEGGGCDRFLSAL